MLLPVIFRFRGHAVSYTDFLSACAFRDIIIRGNRINLASVDQRFSKHRRIIYADDARQKGGEWSRDSWMPRRQRDITIEILHFVRAIFSSSSRRFSALPKHPQLERASNGENLRRIYYSREPRCVWFTRLEILARWLLATCHPQWTWIIIVY